MLEVWSGCMPMQERGQKGGLRRACASEQESSRDRNGQCTSLLTSSLGGGYDNELSSPIARCASLFGDCGEVDKRTRRSLQMPFYLALDAGGTKRSAGWPYRQPSLVSTFAALGKPTE